MRVRGNKRVKERREGRIDWEEEVWLKGKKGKTGREEGWKEETEGETKGMKVVKWGRKGDEKKREGGKKKKEEGLEWAERKNEEKKGDELEKEG